MELKQNKHQSNRQKAAVIWISIIAILFLAAIIVCIFFLSRSNIETTGKVRDIFIIILALELFLIGFALVILFIQLAVLTNIVQNEIKPILATTKETAGTLKGTSKFISKYAVSPIISVVGDAAGGKKVGGIIGFIRKKK